MHRGGERSVGGKRTHLGDLGGRQGGIPDGASPGRAGLAESRRGRAVPANGGAGEEKRSNRTGDGGVGEEQDGRGRAARRTDGRDEQGTTN